MMGDLQTEVDFDVQGQVLQTALCMRENLPAQIEFIRQADQHFTLVQLLDPNGLLQACKTAYN